MESSSHAMNAEKNVANRNSVSLTCFGSRIFTNLSNIGTQRTHEGGDRDQESEITAYDNEWKDFIHTFDTDLTFSAPKNPLLNEFPRD